MRRRMAWALMSDSHDPPVFFVSSLFTDEENRTTDPDRARLYLSRQTAVIEWHDLFGTNSGWRVVPMFTNKE